MKRILVVVVSLVATVVIFGAGIVFAQYQTVSAAGPTQGFGPGMMGGRGGYGPMHDYVEQALADKIGLTKAQIEEKLTAGKSMYQIVLDSGVTEANAPALLSEVHKTAFAKAVTDGVLTQAQADSMLERMNANGFNQANCPMGGQRPADGTGFRGGKGGPGMGGGRWNQPQPTATP